MNGMRGNRCFATGLYSTFNYIAAFRLNGFWKMYKKLLEKFRKFNSRKKADSKGRKRAIKDI